MLLVPWPAELSVERQSQRLYKDTDSTHDTEGCARTCRKIREEVDSVVEKYNRMVLKTETLCLETILSCHGSYHTVVCKLATSNKSDT